MAMQQNQNAGYAQLPPSPRDQFAMERTKVAQRADAPRGAGETIEVTGAAAPVETKENAAQTAIMASRVGVVSGPLARPQPAAGVALKDSRVRWTVSVAGRITRSRDGQTWAEVPVGEGVVFRALSANGADIWAGGSSGALFHSSDGGEHWARVRPSAELTSDIMRIEFTDALHGTVQTSADETWTTADGGKSWARQ